jgi:long-subunit fatty acid transport protein
VDFQTGIDPDTLLFGRLRWVKWSEFRVDPLLFEGLTGQGLVNQRNTRIWTLGLVRQLTPTWAGSVSVDYEGHTRPIHSPLSPSSGKKGVTLAAIHSRDNYRITAGISYVRLGNARLATSTPGVEQARMGDDNHVLGVGIRIGWAF